MVQVVQVVKFDNALIIQIQNIYGEWCLQGPIAYRVPGVPVGPGSPGGPVGPGGPCRPGSPGGPGGQGCLGGQGGSGDQVGQCIWFT